MLRYRYEYKYLINKYTAEILRQRAASVMRPDSHGGAYVVNNLYLDDRYDSFYYDKSHGKISRDKYRLRHYNGDLSFIRLERKHKEGLISYKDTMPVTHEQYKMIKSGDLEFTLEESAPLWQTIGMLHRLRILRPSAIFSYRREAFVYDPGDVRFTFDSPPFDAGEDLPIDPLSQNFGRNEYYPMLLEVKFTGFLPEIIKRLLNGLQLARTDMSKYCVVRERGFLPYGKI